MYCSMTKSPVLKLAWLAPLEEGGAREGLWSEATAIFRSAR